MLATTKNKDTPSYIVVATKKSQFHLIQRYLDWPDQSCFSIKKKISVLHPGSWRDSLILVLVTFGTSKRFLKAYRSCQTLKRDAKWDFLMRSVHWNTKNKVTLIFVSLDFDRKSRMRMRKTFPTETTTAPVDSAAVLRKTRERNNKIKIIKSPHKATTIIINIAASNH